MHCWGRGREGWATAKCSSSRGPALRPAAFHSFPPISLDECDPSRQTDPPQTAGVDGNDSSNIYQLPTYNGLPQNQNGFVTRNGRVHLNQEDMLSDMSLLLLEPNEKMNIRQALVFASERTAGASGYEESEKPKSM